jgi:pyridoxal phosphate enzyme (YggS family)
VNDVRRAELSERLARVRGRIAAACVAAGRDPDEVTLVAVTKTYPVEDVRLLFDLGVHDIGENRDQEAAPKAAALAAAGTLVRWHFVGQLQRNKARSVVRYADLVHSVDSVHLADALAGAADRHRDRPLDVLVQLSLDDDEQRGGVPERDLDGLVSTVLERPGLRLRGVMAVAPLSWDAESAYVRLADLTGRVRAAVPAATIVSAGMSDDMETAIAHGATHVRIGTALLGKRAHLR